VRSEEQEEQEGMAGMEVVAEEEEVQVGPEVAVEVLVVLILCSHRLHHKRE